jgi:predicted outer membrane repeat protein
MNWIFKKVINDIHGPISFFYLTSSDLPKTLRMKSSLSFLLLLSLCFFNVYGQQAYVDLNASGSNDGSSWANAYTNINDALDNPSVEEIWVARGTYIPGTDTSASFNVIRPVKIYGGFAGNESNLEERDPDANLVVLSGDILGDDIPGNLYSNRSDNSRHVIFVNDFSGGEFLLDGVSIRGGTNNDFVENASTDRLHRGAGIYALSPIAISNCTFIGNICYSGAAIFLREANTSGSIISDCQIFDNQSIGQGVVFALNSSNLNFSNLDFNNNLSARGCIYTNQCQNATVDNCNFVNNAYPGGYGAAYFDWQSTNTSIRNCSFEGNSAGNGACIYVDQRDLLLAEKPASNFSITDCTFNNNSATDYGGGALYSFRASYSIDNCVFTQNSAGNSGGAIVNSGNDKVYDIKNCRFENNNADFGGVANNYGDNSMGNFSNCIFKNNNTRNQWGCPNSRF